MNTNQLAAADAQSVQQLFEKFADMVYRLAFVRTKSSSDADDVLQEVFLRYLKSGVSFNDDEHQKAWFIRVAINCSNSLLTSAWRRHTTAQDDNLLCSMERDSDVYREVLALPVKYRTVVHLYYYEGYKVEEIAEMTGTKTSTVKSQLLRARGQLREQLREDDL